MIAIDLRQAAHRGQGGRASFERAVSAAASIALRLGRSGYELALMADDGRMVRPAGMGDQATAVLDFLASVDPTSTRLLVPMANRLARTAGEGLLVAVLGVPSSDEAAALARCRLGFGGASGCWSAPTAGSAWPPARWPRPACAAGIATLLERAGWRTAMFSGTQPLDDPWRRPTAPLGRATPTTHRRQRWPACWPGRRCR